MFDDSFTALAAQARASLNEDSARLRGNLTFGLTQNPDQYAKDMATARKVGAPLDIVQDPKHRAAIEDMARRMNVSADDLLQRAPKTAGWLGSDPHNPSLAHDDLETLQKLEKIFAVPPEGPGRASSALGSWIAGSTRLAKGLTTDASRLGEAIFDRPLGALVESFLPESLLATRRENIRKSEEARSGFDAAVFAPGQQMSKRMINPDYWAINAVFGNLPDLAVAFATAGLGPAASAASKAPAGAGLVGRIGTYLVNRAPMIAAQSATSFPSVLAAEADEYQQFNPNASRVEAVGKAAVSSAVQSVLEGLVEVPIIDKMRASKTLYQRLLGVLGSSQVEGAEEVAQRLVSQALLPDPSGNRKLTAAELFDNWRGGVVAGGVFAGAAIKAPQPSRAEVFFDALAQGATESKLLKRMPEKFQEAVASMVKDGPMENVGIPAIQWATYWQSQGMTAEQAQAEAVAMGVQPEAYQQAMRLGDDLQVPTAAFAARIAPTEHYQGLAQDVRLVPGEQTQREAEESRAEQKARVEEILQTIKETPEDAGIAQIAEIQDEMKVQLQAAGRPAAEANAAAKGFAESIATLAVRNDMTVPDLLRMFRFTVKNGEALARPADGAILPVGGSDAQASDVRGRAGVDPEVGPVLGGGIAADGDGSRAGRAPGPARNPVGTLPVGLGPLPPVVGFHGSKDRNLPANTLEVLKARTGSQLAQGIYITDDAGTAESGGRKYAAQAPDGGSLQEVRHRIQAPVDLGVDKLYSREEAAALGVTLPEVQDEVSGPALWRLLARQHGSLEGARDFLLSHGYDSAYYIDKDGKKAWAIWDQDAVGEHRAVERGGQAVDEPWVDLLPRAEEFNQSATRAVDVNSPEFKAWFGDSKVVDENGQPLVVYHGTRSNGFEVFDKNKIGTQTDDGWLGSGFYFTTDVNVSSDIAGMGNKAPSSSMEMSREDGLPWTKRMAGNGAIGEFFVSLKNPLTLRPDGWQWSKKGIVRDALGIPPTATAEEVASALRDQGYDGVILDYSGGGYPHKEVMAVEPTQIKSATANTGAFDPNNPSILNQTGRRGKITVGRGAASTTLDITLFDQANVSTAAHEFGHAYLTMLQTLAAKPEATQQTKDDLQTIIDTYGEDGKITELAHERFADAHLLYLREGHAPSVALRSAFRRFSKWLADIWSDVKAGMADSGVVLTNDVRGVFDRIYATDTEIELAKHDLAKPFATAEEAHMTDAQFEVYQKTYASQIAEGKETMLAELMRELAAEQSAERKALLERAYDRTLGEIDALPEYRALATLVDGTVAKLSGESLRQMGIDPNTLGTEGIHRAWSNDPSAVDPDAAANLILDELGEQLFPDGVSLVRALVGLESRKGFARRLAQEEVAETFPNTLDDPEALRLLATESLEAGGEAYNRVKAKELRAIRQALRFAGKVAKDAVKAVTTEARAAGAEAAKMPDLAPFRIAAQQKVAGIVLGGTRDPLTGRAHDIGAALKGKAWEYLRTSRKAGGQSLKLMAKGKYAEAAQAKEREILNHFLYLETKKAQAEVKAFSALNKKLGSPGIHQKLGRAGGTYLDQIIKIRGRFSLSDQALEGFGPQRQTLAEWLEDNPDAEIDDRVMDETWSKPVEKLTLDEMRAVRDAMTVIRTMAYQESTVLAEGRRVATEQAEAELVASIAAGHDIKAHPLSESPELQKDKAANLLAGADAMLIKIEQLVNWMDGDKVDGPAHRYILQPFVDAQTRRYDMMAAVAVPLDEAFLKLPEEIRNGLGQRFDVSFVPEGLTRQQILSMAFNMGNDVNKMKLLEGYGWNESQVLEAMSHLTAQELAFVQESWDIVAGLWPDMVALEKRTVGVEPKKQEIAPLRVQLQDGSTVDLGGGYWPLKYDPDAPKNEAVQRKQNAADRLLNGSAAKPGTSRSAVKERTRYVGPLLLDFRSIMGGHLNDVIMDLSHREAINSVDKFIRRPKVKESIQGAFGVKYYRQFEPWLKTIAGDGSSAAQHGLGDFSRAAMSMRSFMITAMLGYRYTSTIVQFADLGRVVAPGPYRVPVHRLASAFAQFVNHPVKTIAMVRELSGEMLHRANNLDRDIRLIMNERTGQQTLLDRFNRGGFKPFVWMDTLASVTTFLGKYQEKMEEHGDSGKAVKEAEQSVRALLQTGNPKDLIAVQRGHEAMKLLTMFMGDQVAGYNMMRNAGHRAKGLGGFAVQFAPSVLWVSALALFAEWLKGNWEDDERKRGKWIATKAAVAPFASIPVFSVAARYFENKALDKYSKFNVTPAFGMIEKVIDTIDLTVDMLGSEKHVDKVDYAIKAGDTLGHALGVAGTSQAAASAKYFVRLQRGQERPSNAAQATYDFVRGKPKERP